MSPSRAPWLLLAALSAIGCESFRDAASTVFVRSTICPTARVTVRDRADVPPHTIYRTGPPPTSQPPEIAGDPERIRLWQQLQPKPFDIDGIAKTFEVSGCGKTVFYVCAHPRIDGGEGPFSIDVVDENGTKVINFYTNNHVDTTMNLADNVLLSSVVCMPASTRSQDPAPAPASTP